MKTKNNNLTATILVVIIIISVIGIFSTVMGFGLTGKAVTATAEVKITIVAANVSVAPSSPPATPGGGGVGATPKIVFRLEPSVINMRIPVREVDSGEFTIINEAIEKVRFYIDVEGLDGILRLSHTNLILNYKSEFNVPFLVTVNRPGIYTGRIVVGADNKQKTIPIIVEAYGYDAEFDVKLYLSSGNKNIYQDEDITGQVTITNLGSKIAEAEITYLIKDFNDNIVAEYTEIKSIPNRVSYANTVDLPDGLIADDYVYAVEVGSGDNLATTSQRFKVNRRPSVIEQPLEIIKPNKNILLLLFIVILITASWMIHENKKSKKKVRRKS